MGIPMMKNNTFLGAFIVKATKPTSINTVWEFLLDEIDLRKARQTA